MRRAIPLLLVLTAMALVAGCGDSENTSSDNATGTADSRPAPATTSTQANASKPAKASKPATKGGDTSPYVVVTSLLGKTMPKEPRCRFDKNFVPDKPTAGAYDGALSLTVTCERTKGYTAVGQIVNRPGSKPTEITCRDTTGGQLYCIYVPSTTVGLYFTGTDRSVVRRRLEHLMEIVGPLPAGITPLPGTSSP